MLGVGCLSDEDKWTMFFKALLSLLLFFFMQLPFHFSRVWYYLMHLKCIYENQQLPCFPCLSKEWSQMQRLTPAFLMSVPEMGIPEGK